MKPAARPLRGLAAGLLLALLSPVAAAQEEVLPAVKAAFVYNFIKLVSWPEARFESPEAPARVCVYEGEPMAPALRQALEAKTFDGRGIRVLTLAPAAELAGCHVLYLGTPQQPRYLQLMARAGDKGLLVIDEGPAFSWPDGMIRLFLEEGRVRFELNLQSVERAGLKIDPRLIRLARIATR